MPNNIPMTPKYPQAVPVMCECRGAWVTHLGRMQLDCRC